MLTKWNIKSSTSVNKINFQWIIFYKHIFNLIFLNLPNLNNSFVFLLTNNLLQNSTMYNYSNKSYVHQIQKPILNRTIDFKTYFKTPTIRNVQSSKFYMSSKTTVYNVFLLYLQYTIGSLTQFFTPHSNFQAFFIISFHNKASYLNIPKVLTRWVHISNFLINLFLLDIKINLFTTKILKQETLSFNWSVGLLNYQLFRYSSPLFFLKDTTFGTNSTLIFKKLSQRGLNTVFLTDLKYHEKNLYYLQRFNVTTISLVPYNLNPWLVTYAIPIAANSLFIQYFFVKLLIYYKQFSLNTQFINLKQLW